MTPLTLTITPTDEVLLLDGLPVRLWRAVLPDGRRCDCYVAAVGSGDPTVQAELAAGLLELPPPVEARTWLGVEASRN